MTATMDLAKFVYDSVTVYVDNVNWKNNWTNGIEIINQPTTNTTPNSSLFINLNKVEDRYTITGHLSNGKYSSETHTTAYDKKNALKTMFEKRAAISLTLEGTTITGSVDKYEISYDAKDNYNETHTDEIVYDVVVSFVKGDDAV